ncbi:unnamed protein product [Alopecurus aequalis]
MASITANVHEIRRAQRADGPAVMLAIGSANPTNRLCQEEYPDYYFRITKTERLTDVKDTFRKICKATGIGKRFFYHTEELLNAHPEFLSRTSPSLDARLEIAAVAAPALAASAAGKAIAEWGRPAGDITHLVVSTNLGAQAPGADIRLASLLGLRPGVCRKMLQLNCGAGCASLRLAKDLAENNRGARVLVACVELSIAWFRGPDEADFFHTLVSQGAFGDGAGAVIVGAGSDHPAERPLFEMVAVSQALIPQTEHVLNMLLGNSGIDGSIVSTMLPTLAADNIERCLLDAFCPLGIRVDWNQLFWAVHSGSRAILDSIDRALRLEPEKLAASRTVLGEYGNMLGATVIFVLDEQRRRMEQQRVGAHKWGVMVGFGPGFAVETMVLRAPGSTSM